MIDLNFDGAVARLVLNRPEVRNALPVAGWEQLAERVAEIRAARVRLVVLSGAGSAFCAGADISEFALLQREEAARVRFRAAMRRGIEALAELPVATVALIEGPCFGAGVALAMGCDLRLAGPAARFAITPAKMGIGYPQEDVARLVGLVGPGWAARLLFTGSGIDAEEAERIGLVQGKTAGWEAVEEAVLANDGDSIAMLKRGIALASSGQSQDVGQDRRFDDLFGSPAVAERLSRSRTAQPLPPPEA